jgi:hypothetical protein
MKATFRDEPPNVPGFWARLARAVEVVEMSPSDLLELRVERLEKQVARLMEADSAAAEAHPQRTTSVRRNVP